MSALVPRSTIEEIVGLRNQAVALYEQAWFKIAEADKAVRAAAAVAQRVSPGVNSYNSSHCEELRDFFEVLKLPDQDKYSRVARRLIDINAWAYIIQLTDLERLMDKEAKDDLREQMRYIPERVDRNSGKLITEDEAGKGLPPLTVENVQTALQGFLADADLIFKRGIANAFAKLDRRFRSHDGFKIGSRVILSRAFNEYGSFSYGSNHRDTLIDIERAFAVLDGKPQGSFVSTVEAISASRRGYSPHQSETETEYFRVRGFKNGNAHLWFVRDDLVEKVNQVLASYYGEVLGDKQPEEDDPLKDIKTTPARHYGFFPTPAAAVREVMSALSLYPRNGLPRRVLEPSAGTGNLARTCVEKGAVVDCVELQAVLADDLRREGIYGRVYSQDFLQLTPETTGLYDCAVMNPPFDRERDIDHVMHALKFLQPDGSLTAIMSAGTEFRSTRKSSAFRKLISQMNGRVRDLPPASFAEVGTYVNTIILTVHKDGSAPGWSCGHRKLAETYNP